MDYSTYVLAALALVGVVLHNLVKINEINKNPTMGEFNLGTYWKKEWASVLISVIVGCVAAFLKSEIKQLDGAGKWLGIGFIAIGYMAQSVLVSFMGKAQKIIAPNDAVEMVNKEEGK